MHPDEIDTDTELARRLVAAQFPQWAALPVRRVESTGTDNAMFRLGDNLCVRLPRIEAATSSLRREQEWVPVLAPRLPLALPVPIGVGTPTEEHPFSWSVLPWFPGEPVTRDLLAGGRVDPVAAAVDLAGFVNVLQALDPTGAPSPGPKSRGMPITTRDPVGARRGRRHLGARARLGVVGGPRRAAVLPPAGHQPADRRRLLACDRRTPGFLKTP